MSNEPIANERFLHEGAVTERFLEVPKDDSFTNLFNTFTPQLIAFFRARSCGLALAEDLAQEVMLIVYNKAAQIRDRTLFRARLFKIARNALCRHYGRQTWEVETLDLAEVPDRLVAASPKPAGRRRKMPRVALLDPTKTGRQAEDLENKLRHLVVGQEDAIR